MECYIINFAPQKPVGPPDKLLVWTDDHYFYSGNELQQLSIHVSVIALVSPLLAMAVGFQSFGKQKEFHRLVEHC